MIFLKTKESFIEERAEKDFSNLIIIRRSGKPHGIPLTTIPY